MSSVSSTVPSTTPAAVAIGARSPAAVERGPGQQHLNDDPSRPPEPALWGLPASAWLKILIVAALLVALFRFNLARLWTKTNPFTGDPNWGHTTIIPLIGLYYLYLNRDRLLAAAVKPILLSRPTRRRLAVTAAAMVAGALIYVGADALVSVLLGASDKAAAVVRVGGAALAAWGLLCLPLGWGVGNLLFGLLAFTLGIYPAQNDWAADYGMVHTVFGVVLTLCGWQVMRVAWFPIAFLVCAIPWPGQVYAWLASPLQHLAAIVAVKTLNFTGIESFRTGTKMFITGSDGSLRALNVIDACAGLRSLMTFISVAAAVAFLSNRAFWQKLVITASAVPIAIFCNVMRVTGQAYLDRLAGPQWSEGFAHGFAGVVMLVPAFFLILLVSWVLDHLFVDDDKAAAAAAAKKRATSANANPTIITKARPALAGATGAVGAAAAAAAAATPTTATRLPPRTNLTGRAVPTGDDGQQGGAA